MGAKSDWRNGRLDSRSHAYPEREEVREKKTTEERELGTVPRGKACTSWNGGRVAGGPLMPLPVLNKEKRKEREGGRKGSERGSDQGQAASWKRSTKKATGQTA